MTLETRSRLAGEAARRGRRARVAVAVAAIAAAIVVVTLALTVGSDSKNVHVTASGAASPSKGGRVENRFVPPTRAEGHRDVMPVLFPNDQRIELTYPRSLALARLGFTPGAEASWNARSIPKPCCDRTILSNYMTLREAYGAAAPVTTFSGFDGRPVGLYNGAPHGMPNTDYLVYRFGPWLVEVDVDSNPKALGDAMTEHERAVWARSLVGDVSHDGFLRLKVRAPLTNLRSSDNLIGAPQVASPQVNLIAGRCSPRSSPNVATRNRSVQGDGEQLVAWCDRATGFRIAVTGPSQFVNIADRSLAVRPATRHPAPHK